MLSYIVELLNFFFDTIIFIGRIIIFCGYSIAYVFSSIASWSFLITKKTFTVIQVLLEDLGCFLTETIDITEEVGYKLCIVASAIKDILEDAYGSKLTYTIGWIGQAFKSIFNKQVAFLRNVVYLLKVLMRLIIDALTLIGTVAQESFRLFLVLIYNIITAPITSFLNLCTAVLDTVLLLADIIVNLPIESAIGFFVVLVFFKLFKRYNGKRYIKMIIKYSLLMTYRFLLLVVTICIMIKWYFLSFLKKIRQKLHKPYIRADSPSKIELLKKLEQEISLRTCVICMSNPRDVMVVGCNHFCMCSSCATQVRRMNNECPVCRKRIYGLSGKVFM